MLSYQLFLIRVSHYHTAQLFIRVSDSGVPPVHFTLATGLHMYANDNDKEQYYDINIIFEYIFNKCIIYNKNFCLILTLASRCE